MRSFISIITLFILLLCTPPVKGINFFQPKRYVHGERVELLLNKIESDHTQIPYSYHDLRFVCVDRSQKSKSLLLGQVINGDRLWESLFDLRFGEDEDCAGLCTLTTTQDAIEDAAFLVKNGYVVHWVVDGLPGATTFVSSTNANRYYAAGFPLGFVKNGISYIYNHFTIVIRYHREQSGMNSIVGFEVYPKSVLKDECPGESKNYLNFPLLPKPKSQANAQIPYSYSVYWREDNSITYNTRWDPYYENDSTRARALVHWMSLLNSLALVFLVSMIMAVVIIRSMRSGVSATSSITLGDLSTPYSPHWRSLVDRVMAKPPQVAFLCTLMASGIQALVAAAGVSVIFLLNSKFSFTSLPSNVFFNNHQEAFFTCSIVLLLASGFVSSFFGVIFHKLITSETSLVYNRTRLLILSCLFSGMLPFSILSSLLSINFLVWFKSSSDALPFGTIVVLVLLFSVIELPLGIFGGTLGNNFELPKNMFLTDHVGVPEEKAYSSARARLYVLSPILSVILSGIIPFGIVYVDLLLVFNTVWLEKTSYFHMYGFLLLTMILLLIVVIESSVVATYLFLSYFGDPNWQWLSFGVGSSLGWYIFAYSIYYFFHSLQMADIVSVLIYFSYMALTSVLAGVMCGSVGVVTSFVFVRKLYTSSKRD